MGTHSDDDDLKLCECCGDRPATWGRRYCSEACRRLAFRSRYPRPLEAHLSHVFAKGTVYYCPGCKTRYFGVERCEPCDRYCRSLGIGGLCPCCDAPVALQDLVGREMTVLFSL
jgi:hypothetical protein